jgi:AraC-like DNA-binding protein
LAKRATLLSNAANSRVDVSPGSTVGSIQVADLLEALRKLGADPASLAAAVGVTVPSADDPGARVRSSLLVELLELAARQLHDPLIGLHAGARAETRGPLFYLLLSSPRISEGLRLFTRFARVPLDSQVMEVVVRDGAVELTIDPSDPAINRNRHAVDYIVGANLSSLRRAIPDFRLLGITLTHEEAGVRGETERVFGCPVRFRGRANMLRFPEKTLRSVPAAANPAIAVQIEKFTVSLFNQLAASSAKERVTAAIRALVLAGVPANRAAVAKRLHVSERTLQRQLEQESATFKGLYDMIRAELSGALLANRAL